MIRRIIGQIHLWVGITLCIPLVILGLTGSVLVFEDELNEAFGPAARYIPARGAARPRGEIVAAARAVAPASFAPVTYVAPLAAGRLASVRLSPARSDTPGADAMRVSVDPVSLDTIPDPQSDYLRQVFFLHSTLLLKNREGRQLVGWLGVAMLIMGVSGLVNWWPRSREWRIAFTVSRRARGFRLYRELHGAAGIWGLMVFVTVSCAGVYLAFPESVRNVVDRVLPARDLRASAAAIRVEPIAGAEPIDIDEAIALARSSVPDSEPSLVFLPMRPDQPFRIGLLRTGQERRSPAVTVFVDPWARRIVQIFDPRQFSLGEEILAWQHAVHAGQALGWVWKIPVFLCGLLPLLFAVSGVTMWRLKRRPQKSLSAASGPVPDHVYTARRAGE